MKKQSKALIERLRNELECREADVRVWKDTAIKLEKQLRGTRQELEVEKQAAKSELDAAKQELRIMKDMKTTACADFEATREVARGRYDEIQALKAQLAASSGERKRLEHELKEQCAQVEAAADEIRRLNQAWLKKDQELAAQLDHRLALSRVDELSSKVVNERSRIDEADKTIVRLEKELRETRQDLDGERKWKHCASEAYTLALSANKNVLVNPYLERRLRELLPECKSFDDFFDWITDAKNIFRDGEILLKRATKD